MDLDRLLAALADEERRELCRFLLSRRETVTLDELDAYLATATGEHRRRAVEAGTDRVDVRLHHVHLPKLEEVAVLEYDRERYLVEPGPALSATEALLEALPTVDDVAFRHG